MRRRDEEVKRGVDEVKEKYEEDKLKWYETADVERLEVQTTKDAAKVSKALERARQLGAANSASGEGGAVIRVRAGTE